MRRSSKNPLRKMVNIVRPSRTVVSVIVHVPDVRDVLLLQIGVNALGNIDEAILVATGNVEQLQLLPRDGGIRHEFSSRLGVWRGRKSADPRKRVEMPKPK